ncbi:MAG TPA: hydroxymethylglutaryl-CoA lyase [Acidimicrobiales bacterium]|nr:hydroxymethylglutaryl-CoA lyase [Acidimicrobiales bacterium]
MTAGSVVPAPAPSPPAAFGLPDAITIREVGPRDGLQPEAPVRVGARIDLVEALVAAGVTTIEAAAFVSPKAVPAMAGGAEVMAGIGRVAGVSYVALVPNVRGAQLAVAAGVDGVSLTVSASEAYSQRNVRMSVEESLAQVAAIRAAVGGEVPIDTVISCAFGSPYEGDLAPEDVAALGSRALAEGATTLTYADTTGMATPRRVAELVALTGTDVGLHLHDTRGTALVNAYAALQLGVVRFDTAVGGLGGSPFAAGAGGNLATEDLVHLCDDMGVATGIDLALLLGVSARVSRLVGRAVPSRVAVAGPRSRLQRT